MTPTAERPYDGLTTTTTGGSWVDRAHTAAGTDDRRRETVVPETAVLCGEISSKIRTITSLVRQARSDYYELGRQHQAEIDQIHKETAAEIARIRARVRMPVRNPPALLGEGFLYVIAFTTGTVKVGQTEDPQQRLNTHQAEAAAFGVGATAYWISPAHSNFITNETLLIEQCRTVSRRSRREYFHEVGYERAVQFALDLDYQSQITNQVCAELDRR